MSDADSSERAPLRYDLVIVGGGLVGASLACALRGTGLRIAVIEAIPFDSSAQPSYDERTITLSYGSSRIFEGMGVWQDVERGGAHPIKRIHISDRGHFARVRLDAAQAGTPALGYVVETRVLGAVLQDALARAPSVSSFCPAKVSKITVDKEEARVLITSTESEHELRAPLIVGADGARSSVRELLGVGARRVDYGQTAIVSTMTAEFPHEQTAYERFTPSGPIALLPMSENRCATVWSVPPTEVNPLLALPEEEFLARFGQDARSPLGRFARLGKRLAFPLALVRAQEQVHPRAVLIGNAAHTLHPVAGQGFNLGLRDVAVLAQITVDAQRAGRDLGDQSTLQEYMRWRRRDTLAVTGFTDGLTRIFSNAFPPFALARNAGLLAADLLPPVKRALVKRTMGLAGRLPRLTLGLPL